MDFVEVEGLFKEAVIVAVDELLEEELPPPAAEDDDASFSESDMSALFPRILSTICEMSSGSLLTMSSIVS